MRERSTVSSSAVACASAYINNGSGICMPCAACKMLRRRCTSDCVFAPFFPPDQPHKFASVHRVFGASNVSKLLQEVPWEKRGDAVNSMVYEADARVRDPVYGCAGTVYSLQFLTARLQEEVAACNARISSLTRLAESNSSVGDSNVNNTLDSVRVSESSPRH